MASNGQGSGQSGNSFSKRGRKSGRKEREPKVRQRGLGIAKLEALRLQNEMAAATANVAGGTVVPNNLPDASLTSFTSNQLHGGSGDSSSPSLWQTYDTTTASTCHPWLNCSQSTMMSMGNLGCDLRLGLSTRLEEDQEIRQPNYFTNLLLGEDSKEEKGHKNKKARMDSSATGSLVGSSQREEPDLELRL